VQRFIYTSSLTTIGKPPPGSDRLADERDFYVPGSANSAYFEAKWAMEQEAFRAAESGLPIVILVTCAALGPGDLKPTTSDLVLMVARRLVPVAVDVTANIIDGRDVAEAHIRAATVGAPGERIIVGGHNLNARAILRTIAAIAGVGPPRLTLRMQTARRLLSLAKIVRLPVPDLLLGLEHLQPVNAEKGWKLFGMTPRPFEETVRDTLDWFRANGYLKQNK
jgi:dihydroflavonol-4-reductase